MSGDVQRFRLRFKKQGDLRLQVEMIGDVLRVRVSVKREGTARPRELLALVGLSDLEQQGVHWTRTAVELDS